MTPQPQESIPSPMGLERCHDSEFAARLLQLTDRYSGIELLHRILAAFNARFHNESVFLGALKDPQQDKVVAIVSQRDGCEGDCFEYSYIDQPCHEVYRGRVISIPCDVQSKFAGKRGSGYESFFGIPISHPEFGVIAHLAAYSSQPSTFDSLSESTVRLIELLISREVLGLIAEHANNTYEELWAELTSWKQAALRDKLTGLGNRRALERHWTDLKRRKRLEYCYISIIDIDRFKELNDTYGHDVGDISLKHLSHFLDEVFTPTQTRVFRLGGEEFGILGELEGVTDIRGFLESMRESFAGTFAQKANLIPTIPAFTFSAGFTSTAGYTDLYAALKYADNLLYEAKEQGRDRILRG